MSKFDFNKAINREPIYCNGTRIYPIYDIFNKKFLYLDDNWDNEGNGRSYPFPHKLTTDPTKKKVKKTVHLFKSKVSIAVILRLDTDTFPEEKYWYKCGETEIEVEE